VSTADSLDRRQRRRARRRFFLEVFAVLGLTGAAVGIIYLLTAENVASPWKRTSTQLRNVSRASGIQTEVAVAVDSRNARNLFAASNESLEPEIRVYTSTDGGESWSSRRGPHVDFDSCAWGDPAVAIGPDGRQYVAFTQKSICSRGPDLTPYLIVASRAGPRGKWLVRRVTRPAVKFGFDDKPAIAVTGDGRVHVVWSRLLRRTYQTTVISSSNDGGRSWSPPRPVDSSLEQPQLVSLAAGPRSSLYIAGVDAEGVWVGRSVDGGRHFAIKPAAPLPGSQAATCIVFGNYLIPQQAVRCLGPNPTVSVGTSRVYVTYARPGTNETQDVAIAVFDLALRPLFRGTVGPVDDQKSDQFWPVAAADPKTGRIWACYYDSSGDHERKRAWFTCTSSSDGERWATPVRAAEHPANAGVLWEDARIFGFGDAGGYGGYPGLAVANGVAYPLWIDTRGVDGNEAEIFGARLVSRTPVRDQ
jgi:hypothetical protein